MTVRQAAEALHLKTVSGKKSQENRISGLYCGDLLSWVMSRIRKGDAWITVMGNVNTVAVASLAESSCIILAEGASLDAAALGRAAENDIAVLSGDMPAARIVRALSHLMDAEPS